MGRISQHISPGSRSGPLVIIKDVDGFLECQCDCGKVVQILKENLRKDRVRCSKGCTAANYASRKYRPNAGERFGDWTVVSGDIIRKGRPAVLCRCICGAVKEVVITDLGNNRTSHCKKCGAKAGASKRQKPTSKIGNTYGKLTVLNESVSDGRRMAGCSCECGSYKVFYLDNVLSGRVTSCGCRREKRAAP